MPRKIRRWVVEERPVPSQSKRFVAWLNCADLTPGPWKIVGSGGLLNEARAVLASLTELAPKAGLFVSGTEFRLRRIDKIIES